MSAEYAAEVIADMIAGRQDAEVLDEPCEDMRSGGFFFDVTIKGRDYEVMVVETSGGGRP